MCNVHLLNMSCQRISMVHTFRIHLIINYLIIHHSVGDNSCHLMYSSVMFFQITFIKECFLTEITLIRFVSFMYLLNVSYCWQANMYFNTDLSTVDNFRWSSTRFLQMISITRYFKLHMFLIQMISVFSWNTDYGGMMAISQILYGQYHIWNTFWLGLKSKV